MMWLSLIIATIFTFFSVCSPHFVFEFYSKLFEYSIRAKISPDFRESDVGLEISFPKTKWCGPGNTAEDYDDLGEDRETDRCCRAHDHCPLSLDPGKEMCGTINTRVFSISGCDCDERFRRCLEKSMRGNPLSTAPLVAKIYSSIITKCIYSDPKTKSCSIIDSEFK